MTLSTTKGSLLTPPAHEYCKSNASSPPYAVT